MGEEGTIHQGILKVPPRHLASVKVSIPQDGLAELRRGDHGELEVAFLQRRALPGRVLSLGAPEVRPGKVGPIATTEIIQIGIRKLSSLRLGSAEIGVEEPGPSEACPPGPRPGEVRIGEVGPGEVGPFQIGFAEVGARGLHPAEIATLEIELAEVRTAEAGILPEGTRR